ncbi:MAG TPA: ATP-binding protein [Planctomycetota bacterium]|jgi:heavy metal sensor kinase|nr:ATP-binding protein [Planctomycetota bacterium]
MAALVFLTATAGLGALGLLAVQSALLEGADRDLDEELGEVAREIEERPLTLGELEAYLVSTAAASPHEPFFRVTRPDGTDVASSSAALSPLFPRLRPGDGTVERRTLRIPGDEHRHRLAVRRFETRAAGPVVVEVAVRLRHEEETMDLLTKHAAVAGPLVALFAALLGVFVAQRALRPIDAIDRAARTIGAGPGSVRLPRPGTGDELDRLAGTLNDMLGRLEAAAARNLRFAGDVAHEVRNPLATVRARLEGALAAVDGAPAIAPPLEAALAEVGRLEALLQSLLLICRADEGRVALAREPVDLAALAREAVEFFGPLAEEHGITLGLVANGTAHVEGDPALLRRLVANLVDNALRYSAEGGEIRVRVAREAGSVRLDVADRGPGIDPAAREKVFERFFRSERARALNPDGSGLGLALVRAVARAHGGEAAVAPNPGGGSVFSVDLPGAELS